MSDLTTAPPDASTPAEALLAHVDDLLAVLGVSRQLAATTKLAALLSAVERAAFDVLECERATVFVYDARNHELYSRHATGVDSIRFSADLGIAGEAVRTRGIIDVPDAYADERFNRDIDRETGFRTRNLLTLPLLGFDDSVVGVLQLLNKRDGAFDKWDHELSTAFAAQVGVALQRQLLLEHYAEKRRYEADLATAREIQRGLLPATTPTTGAFDIRGSNRPADETGGDYFDYFTREDGQLALTIADVSGHGIGPALIAAQCRAFFRASASVSDDLSEIAGRVNVLMCQDVLDDRFATSVFALVDGEADTVRMISAGHGPMILLRASGEITELEAAGMPLGILDMMTYSDVHAFTLEPDDAVVLITDGFFEQENNAGEPYGLERVYEVLRGAVSKPAEEMIADLFAAVDAHAAGAPQGDDLTALVVRRT